MKALLYFLIWLVGFYCGGMVITRATYVKLHELKKKAADLEKKVEGFKNNGA